VTRYNGLNKLSTFIAAMTNWQSNLRPLESDTLIVAPQCHFTCHYQKSIRSRKGKMWNVNILELQTGNLELNELPILLLKTAEKFLPF